MTQSTTARAWAAGGLVFAAVTMLLLGIWQILVGIAAIVEDEFFVVTPNYTYDIDTTAWGWTHLGIGVLLVLSGLALFSGANWARVIGIMVAALSAIANFLFLPYYPLWSLAIIALAVFVIWALASTWSRQPGDDRFVPERADYRTAGSRAGGDEWPGPGRPAAPAGEPRPGG
jgi:hypothetical protein